MEKYISSRFLYIRSLKKNHIAEFKTKELEKEYRKQKKLILNISKDKNKSLAILKKMVKKWYINNGCDLKSERVYINTKLQSYMAGGCGIEASFIASFTASMTLSFLNNNILKTEKFYAVIYVIIFLCGSSYFLLKENKNVEMYNLFLEAVNEILISE
ncbi:hypothetical protein [Clostridium sp. BJN0001]|uniref:hypothetical protein n=1 Tax=Clostridium sp. BJN0001 TaxID=2930219 RepID=UPI001FD4114E|nr:hypothetical protein [Clostridium sp. BJN0001]